MKAIENEQGLVHIGLKPVDAPLTFHTGVIPAITRAQLLEGQRALEAAGVVIKRSYVTIPAVLAVIDPAVAATLRKLPSVNYIEPATPGAIATPLSTPQDTSWGSRKVRAPQAWYANRGHNASVTMLDTGVDYDHLVTGDGPVRLTASSCLTTFSSCFDDHGHGSHVAGIAAARDDHQGFIGIVNYDGIAGPSLASVKVCDMVGSCPAGAVIAGLDWTAVNGRSRQVVNMSLSLAHSTTLSNAVAASYNAGNLLVGAAGNQMNSAEVFYPARYSQVIAVAGTLPDDTPAGWITCPNEIDPYPARSNFGAEVELSAPFWAKSMWVHGTYETHCGTSMASPIVSGVAALVWTENPTWSNAQVRAHLQATARDLGAPGRDQYYGYGRVDAGAAVGKPYPSVSISGLGSITSFGNYTWTANASGGVGGFTYEWYRQIDYWWPRGSRTCHYQTDWVLVGTGPSYSSSVGVWEHDFRLRVVLHSGGEDASANKLITVGNGSQVCVS